jgi:type IV secretion system protein VirB3
MKRYPLYKGATRVATYWGVPFVPLVGLVMGVGIAVMFLGLWWLGLLIPGWLLMREITKSDDRAYRILWLWAQTKLWNRLLTLRVGAGDFWGASTYSLSEQKTKAGQRRETRWGG